MSGLGELIERGRDVVLLEQTGADEHACRLCRSRVVRSTEVPSMLGYGFDQSDQCNACGAYTITDPFTGVTSIYRKRVSPAVREASKPTGTCRVTGAGGYLRCWLPAGHEGLHESRVIIWG